ncbi:MAG TPA: dicarboxylate/amino acid:cation symporter [Candidatus Caccocola faecigallinarum]|nr:dicarboxylate/amino acid:cation symporter [Candidatus Caccocola faecigallinarum]
MKKIGLTTKVFIGFIVGVILGIVFQEKILFLKIVGDIFLSLIKMLVVPLVFFSIISGITNITDIERLKRVGTKIVGMYFITTLLSAFLGLGVGHLIQPGKGFVLDTASALNYEPTAIPSVTSTILSMFPTNIIQSMAAGDMMPIIVFCAFFGVAMTLLGDKVKNVRIFINESTEIMYRMTAIVMEASPYGVCALMACTIGQYGLAVFGPLGKFIFCDYFSCAIIVCVMYFLILKFMGKIKFSYFMRKILPLWAVTASTTSSSGSLPVTMSITDKDFKVEEELYGFSLPLGATINMNAGGAYYAVAVVFASQIYGIPMTIGQELIVALLATLISIGSPGIPGGGIVMTVMLLTTMGLPVEVMGMIAGIYKIIDIAHTTINVTGDVVCTIAVARSEGMIHDNDSPSVA